MHPRPKIPPNPLPTWVNRHIQSDVFTQRSRYTAKNCSVHAHVALIFRGRHLIAIGQNRVECRGPFSMIHAEADAIRAAGTANLRGATLVVIRLSRTGLLCSKPCCHCVALMEKCKRAYGLRGYIHS